jgi:predicted transcriptional regulator of viral defense system
MKEYKESEEYKKGLTARESFLISALARQDRLAKRMGNITILKRLGYILEVAGLLDDYKDVFRKFTPSKGYPALDPISPRKGRHNSRWGLLVNFEIDPKRWRY